MFTMLTTKPASVARARPMLAAMALLVALGAASPSVTMARGPLGRPGDFDCEQARCDAVEQIAEVCPCETAVRRRSHIACVAYAAKALVAAEQLPAPCKATIVRCAARSTCGTTARVACWWTAPNGSDRCRIMSSAERCEARGGTAALGSCCADCGTSTTTTSLPTTSTSTTSSTSLLDTTTTSTTSTSTSTSTLLPCGGLFPTCLGSCPPGQQCTAGGIGQPCACAP